MRYDVAQCLRGAGYAVVEAASGEEAIALCKSDVTIDMVFTDINLDGPMSGWDVAECFRLERPNPRCSMLREKPLTRNAVFPAAFSSASRMIAPTS